jgi:hypothetical protein
VFDFVFWNQKGGVSHWISQIPIGRLFMTNPKLKKKKTAGMGATIETKRRKHS